MKQNDIKILAKKAISDKNYISILLKNLDSKEDKKRYKSFEILLFISEKCPKILYQEWDFFEEFLDSENSYKKLIAVRIISNLVSVDDENKFDIIFEKFYKLLNDSVIISRHLARNSGKIVKAKPKLEENITNILLDMKKSNHKHKDLIIGDVVEAFDDYYKDSIFKKEIIDFVKNQKDATSPRTRKIVMDFIKKWEK